MQKLSTFSWLGSDQPCLDEPKIAEVEGVLVGRYGGCIDAGAYKNEDDALVWRIPHQGWVFAALLDAHTGSDSAAAVLTLLESLQESLAQDLACPVDQAFSKVQNRLVQAFSATTFLEKCRSLTGKTACLICVQKGKYLWWFSVGDCVVYLLHSELAQLGQVALNQRQFFEWIGRVNTFDNPVPSFTTGIRELRRGLNTIVMLTDGLLEFGSRPFDRSQELAKVLLPGEPQDKRAVQRLLQRIHKDRGRDQRNHHLLGPR